MNANMPPSPSGGQADRLRSLAQGGAADGALENRRERVLLVAGSKGGVGATAVTLAIARDFAARVGPTLVTSACPGRSDLAMMAGATDPPTDRGESIPLDERLVLFRKRSTPEPNAESFLADAMGRLPVEGWLVIDAGLADSAWCTALTPLAGRLLLVTTPDNLSRLNAFGAVKRLSEAEALPALGVVVNHATDDQHAREAADSLAQPMQRFLRVQAPMAGWLPTRSTDPSAQPIETARSTPPRSSAAA